MAASEGLKTKKKLLHIDGSMLEGGGQILRNSAALSAITGTPIEVDSIRAGRPKPGLAPQHLTGLQLIERICQGELQGGEVRSTRIQLQPGPQPPHCGAYSADTKTAGSCTLMMQAALPLLIFATPSGASRTSELEVRGGTDADMAPPGSYLVEVLAPQLRRLLGLQLEVALIRRGFMPQGGGIMTARVEALPPGSTLPAFDLTRQGTVSRVRIHSFTAGRAPTSAAQQLADAAEAQIRGALARMGTGGSVNGAAAGSAQVGVGERQRAGSGPGPGPGSAGLWPGVVEKMVVQETAKTAIGNGAGLGVVVETDTGCIFGATGRSERGVPFDATASTVVEEVMEAVAAGACVDQWLQDQLIIFMALAKGTSKMLCTEPTLHARTAMVVAEKLMPGCTFTVKRLAPAVSPGGAEMVPAGAEMTQEGAREQQQGSRSGQEKSGIDRSSGQSKSEGKGKRKQPAAGSGSQGLYLVECQGAGWVAGS